MAHSSSRGSCVVNVIRADRLRESRVGDPVIGKDTVLRELTHPFPWRGREVIAPTSASHPPDGAGGAVRGSCGHTKRQEQ